MCGIHWYRELLAKADDNPKLLAELQTMLQERYQLSHLPGNNALNKEIPPSVLKIYLEIGERLDQHK